MKILIITQNFPPDIGGAAIRLSGYAKYLTLFGHTVNVLCANPVYPRGRIFEGYKNKWFQREKKDNYIINRTWIWPIKPKSSFILRIVSYCSFVFSACQGSWKLEKPDVIISASPSFFASFVSLFYKKLKKVKIILDITDVWPDSAIATGFMKKGFLFSVAKKLEGWIYKNVDYITCGSMGTKKELLRNSVPEDKITVIPDAADLNLFNTNIDSSFVKKKYEIDGKFIVGYSGLIGFAQDPKNIVMAAQELKNYKDIIFLVVGDGGLKEAIETLSSKLKLKNIIFAGEKPRETVPSFIKSFSVGLVTLAKNDLFRNSMPSKLFDYLAAGIPTIVNLDGVAWGIIKESQSGLLSKECDPKDLAEKILYLYNNANLSIEMGKRGKLYIEEHYDRKKIVKKLDNIIDKVVE